MRHRVIALVAVALATVVTHHSLSAQGSPPGPAVDPNLQFEAATIKPYDASSGMRRMMTQPGRLEATGIPVRLLLRQALRVQDFQIVGGPEWVSTEPFAIIAKAPDGAPPNAMPVMINNLLKDRFKLVTHTETRELPIFALVLARSDGRLGTSLKPASAECEATIKARGAGPGRGGPGPGAGPGGPGARAAGPGPAGGPPPGPPDFNQPAPCGTMRLGPGLAGGGGQPITQIVTMLSQFSGRPVVDRTGLTGLYDFDLKWAPEPGAAAGPLGGPPPGAPQLPIDPDAPNLFTAVQEQLGLKLENQRGPVEVTVIDHIERPATD